ncbi:SIR2 family protein [Parageobacillus toebii]|uniref:SIR2 family protein n=1 Tax=Parageobacillus toebii TaxID=153151 RepID=UPI002E22D4B1|nr:SIR2 family protein [Parageobacillus toebii]
MTIEQQLEQQLKEFNSAPFLFIGSGFSRRYLGLEDWEGLLKKFAKYLPNDFDYYRSIGENQMPMIAQAMAEDFHELWWKDEKFKSSREEFRGKVFNKTSPLKIEIAKYLRTKHQNTVVSKHLEREIEKFKKVVVDGVITTNWDLFLEKLFGNEYKTYVGQEELLFANPTHIAEIYKIHGCSTDPNSLVLTHKDYENFRSKNAYLAAKLMTIFVEHPIIFIGYSISDPNIIEILSSIAACLSEDKLIDLQKRLIFLQRDKNNQGESFHPMPMVLDKNITLTVTCIRTNDFGKVYGVLSKNRRKFPAKLLSQMKNQIYELVKANDPNGQIYAVDIDQAKGIDFSKVEFVFGIGISKKLSLVGYKSIKKLDLFEDIIFDNKNFEYKNIVRETLPELLKQDRFIPVYKFVSQSGLRYDELDQRIKQNLNLEHSSFIIKTLRKKVPFIQEKCKSIDALIDEFYDNYGMQRVLEYIPLLKIEDIDLEKLKEIIIENWDFMDSETYKKTLLRRLIRLYDWLKYKDVVRDVFAVEQLVYS